MMDWLIDDIRKNISLVGIDVGKPGVYWIKRIETKSNSSLDSIMISIWDNSQGYSITLYTRQDEFRECICLSPKWAILEIINKFGVVVDFYEKGANEYIWADVITWLEMSIKEKINPSPILPSVFGEVSVMMWEWENQDWKKQLI